MFRFFEFITEIIGWLLILLSPFLIGFGIGAVFYFSEPSTFRLTLGILIAAYGLAFGIVLASAIWKKHGTIHFLSQISATPELDSKESESNKKVDSENHFFTRIQKKCFSFIACLLLIAILINLFMFSSKQTEYSEKVINTYEPIIPKDTFVNKPQVKFNIGLNLSMPETDSIGGKIDISKSGVQCETIYLAGNEKSYSLDLNSFYLFQFSKTGFTSKVVYFDTHVPDGRENEEFAKFIVEVTLKKTKNGNLDTIQNVGGVKYDSLTRDFAQVKN